MDLKEASRQDLLIKAEEATDHEHELTFLQAIKLYPKAVAWSVIMSTALVMDGYDTKLLGSLFAQPAFQKAYGNVQPNGSYQISAPWQAGLNNGSNVGQLLGLVIGGSLSEWLGFRKTIMIGLVVAPCIVFMQFFAPSIGVLQAAQVLLGLPLGMFQTVVTVYALEVMPVCLRSYLTSYNNMCWVFGQLIASGVLRGVLNFENSWAYRVPFAIQWFWPIPLVIGVYFAPESPWWLVRQNRPEDAKAALRRLTSPQSVDFDIDKSVALMVLTTEHESEINSSTQYSACFKGTDLRRTIIVIGCYCMQVLSGSTLRAYATYFFEQAGLPTAQAFNLSIATYALSLVGVILSWLLMPHVGRRTLFLCGLSAIAVMFFIVGGLGIPQAASPSTGLAWTIGAFLMISAFVSNITVGPVSYSLVAEIPSSLLRSKSVVIGRFTYACLNIVANVITPYQLNPTAWNWRAKAGFFWGGTCTLGLLFTYFFIPEPKDRTTAELDLLFEKKVPARGFVKAEVHLSEVEPTRSYHASENKMD
ncbi:general substrate transporter [Lipomyces kononenkoae]|uniref:General substrate transporter n=1 Tax=Lipomyces kononenkoae TaxID=34357 RepID=A0ACC3SRA8_LIPKO